MDKNAIKKYAVWARRELISRVSQKALQYGITEENIVPADAATVNGVVLSNEEKKQRRALIEKINDKGYQQVMEEVAYTWFNRFIALRFMEVNGYLPSHVRVFTDDENNFKPQILAEAINLDFDGLNMDKVYELKGANDNEALFKYLLIVQCNALNPIMPRMFQKISDYTELLFPDNLLREGSVVQQMIELIPEEDWKDAVQIIGWLYQYYNSEKKDEVFAALKKNVKITKENVPAATQLFTPDWIVRYMVENSLGRLWVEGHPSDELKAGWKYYLEEAEQEPDVQTQLAAIRKEYAAITPEQIKCIDPCSGSGHICAYMFDVLVQIYEAYGYTAREAVRGIVENNIYGLDIDERAAQLAYFAVMMKARQYDRRFLTRKDEDGSPDVPQPHVYAIVESNGIDAYALDYFVNGDPKLQAAMDSIMKEMRDAKEYGSILNITPVDFAALYTRFDEVNTDINIMRDYVLTELLPLVKVSEMLVNRYDVVITNPPYMNSSGMDSYLLEYVKDHYQNSKSDISFCFMEKCAKMCKNNGLYSMINIPVWMNISSCEKFRNTIIKTNTMFNMLHFGRGVFGSDFGSCAFVFYNRKISAYSSCVQRLFEKQGGVDTIEEKEIMFFNREWCYTIMLDDFLILPANIFAYSLGKQYYELFANAQRVGDYATARQGMATADNNRFLRLWFETSLINTAFDVSNNSGTTDYFQKWVPYSKGGSYRKWFGNNDYLVNWQYNGSEIRAFKKSVVRNPDFYFRKGLTWTALTAGNFSMRFQPDGFAFDSMGSVCFLYDESNLLYILGMLNSCVGRIFLNTMCPNFKFDQKPIENVPMVYEATYKTQIDAIVERCIAISKQDWDAFEVSWDFRKHPLVPTSREWAEQRSSQFADTRVAKFSQLAWHYDQWEYACKYRFDSLKENEEALNRIFIDIYGLQDELTPEVADNDVTVRLADKKRDIKSLLSYAVGCMFGRYSLDVEGLAFAGGEWDDSKYVTFKADIDSIIPICDDEYFSDDIVGRFVRFIEVVYGKETLNENLRFIADALGGTGQPKDVIRKYFMDEFYADHCAIYSGNMGKRPIYWLFDSGKKNGFKALVYMHRYQTDTIARMRTDYVHEQQSRYRTAIADLEQRIVSASTSERVKLNKKLKTMKDQAVEIQGYEEKIHHLADQYISIDLDDGVKVNYAKFQDVLAKIK